MNFETTSHETWEQMRKGTAYEQPARDNGEYQEDFYGGLGNEGIDFKKVLGFIKNSRENGTLTYDRNNFITESKSIVLQSFLSKPELIQGQDNINLTYKNEFGVIGFSNILLTFNRILNLDLCTETRGRITGS